MGFLVMEPEQVQTALFIPDDHLEQSSPAWIESLFPSRDDRALDQDGNSILGCAYGGDPRAIFVAEGSEKQQVKNRMEPLLGQ